MQVSTMPVYVIAEAGVNHDGSEKRAMELVDIAARAGADAVKFQLFDPAALVTAAASCAPYQLENLGGTPRTQQEMLAALSLPAPAMQRLEAHCLDSGVDFLCTPFDMASLAFLHEHTRMRYLKLASGEITNAPLLLAAARTGLPLILSTGMSSLDEVGEALSLLYFGYTKASGHPSAVGVPTPEMLLALREKVVLLHCVSQYPAPAESLNLLAMDTLAETFFLPVGFSDHSLGVHMAVAAVARGAQVIEKHFTYDATAAGPDHAASLSPSDLAAMITAIRQVSAALGTGEKLCQPVELPTRDVARRSVVAALPIRKGEVFTTANIGCKRPGTGPLKPHAYWDLLGRQASMDYPADAFIAARELA